MLLTCGGRVPGKTVCARPEDAFRIDRIYMSPGPPAHIPRSPHADSGIHQRTWDTLPAR